MIWNTVTRLVLNIIGIVQNRFILETSTILVKDTLDSTTFETITSLVEVTLGSIVNLALGETKLGSSILKNIMEQCSLVRLDTITKLS